MSHARSRRCAARQYAIPGDRDAEPGIRGQPGRLIRRLGKRVIVVAFHRVAVPGRRGPTMR